jgi:hypothetical protein
MRTTKTHKGLESQWLSTFTGENEKFHSKRIKRSIYSGNESTWKSKFFLLSRRSASRYRALLEHVYHKQRRKLQVGCLNFPHWFRSMEEGH